MLFLTGVEMGLVLKKTLTGIKVRPHMYCMDGILSLGIQIKTPSEDLLP